MGHPNNYQEAVEAFNDVVALACDQIATGDGLDSLFYANKAVEIIHASGELLVLVGEWHGLEGITSQPLTGEDSPMRVGERELAGGATA